MGEEHEIEEAARLIGASKRLVAFSGAGVSAESGIPTFRDPGGLWDRYDPGEVGGGDIFSSLLSGSSPETTSRFISEFLSCFEKAHPNPGHVALKELEEMGILRSVITQNIDNLHSEAGNTDVIEVHGNVYRMLCLNCGRREKLARDEFLSLGRELLRMIDSGDLTGILKLVSKCVCGGIGRLDVVAFGEPVQDLGRAVQEARTTDLLLILGTSGVVWPAASLPGHAKKAGAKLVEINATGCYFPEIVDIGIVGKTGEVLPRIVRHIRHLKMGSGLEL